ncbi:MAG: hypothetical protein ACXVGE_13065 [Blastococcus sp.]
MKLNGMTFRVVASIDGEVYEAGPINSAEAEKIQAWTGYGVREWEGKLVDESDPLAARGLLGLMLFRKGENVRFGSVVIDDVDSIEAEFQDTEGRVLSVKLDDDRKPVIVGNAPVLLLDGEEVEPVPTGRLTSHKPD